MKEIESGRNIQESTRKKITVKLTLHEKMKNIWGKECDEDGCGGEEKERKTERRWTV